MRKIFLFVGKHCNSASVCAFFLCRRWRVLLFCLRTRISLRSESRSLSCISSPLAAKVHFYSDLHCVCVPVIHAAPFFFKGILRVWDPNTARCVFSQTLTGVSAKNEKGEGDEEEKEKADNPRSLTHLLLLPASLRLATVTAEHNIMLYQLPGLTTLQQVGTGNMWQDITPCQRVQDLFAGRFSLAPSQFVGYSDEVLDVKFLGKDDSHIVVATNSCQLKVFELASNSCQILYGHTGETPAGGSLSTANARLLVSPRPQIFDLSAIIFVIFPCNQYLFKNMLLDQILVFNLI